MCSEQAFWKNFCECVGRIELFEKWPGSKYADHARGNRELQAELKKIFETKSCEEWIRLGDEKNFPIAPVNTPKSIVDDPQFRDRFPLYPHEKHGAAKPVGPEWLSADFDLPERRISGQSKCLANQPERCRQSACNLKRSVLFAYCGRTHADLGSALHEVDQRFERFRAQRRVGIQEQGIATAHALHGCGRVCQLRLA